MLINPLEQGSYLKRSHDFVPDNRKDYFRDQTAIIHSHSFRRLKHKTQVFYSPQNDHLCTRIEHVMHVATVAASICYGLNDRGLKLDPQLAYAIGLGHDLGHAPFGHSGEMALSSIRGIEFFHELHSYRIVEKLANEGKGLNLTYAVKDGIIGHNGEKFEKSLTPSQQPNDLEKIKTPTSIPTSYEGCIVRFSDKIAYLGRDIEDALIVNYIKAKDIPTDIKKSLGMKNGEIINTLISDLIENSSLSNVIQFSDEKYELISKLKDFNYKAIYFHKNLEDYRKMCEKVIHRLFDYLLELYGSLGRDFHRYLCSGRKIDRKFGGYLEKMLQFYDNEGSDELRIVTDYIAGMTDIYALDCIKQITIPDPLKL